MAISEVCKYQVKKEIDACVKKGMSKRAAAKWLAGVLTKDSGLAINSETIRKMDQRARQEVGTNVPTEEWPKCKKCRTSRVKQGKWVGTGEPGESGGEIMAPAPASHGLCDLCRKKELREQREKKESLKHQRAQEEFDQIPLDPQAEQDWTKLAEQLEGLWTLEEVKTGTGNTITTATFNFTIGKVSPEVLERVNVAFKLIYDEIEEVRGLSQDPALST
jgi:hypothetical protein